MEHKIQKDYFHGLAISSNVVSTETYYYTHAYNITSCADDSYPFRSQANKPRELLEVMDLQDGDSSGESSKINIPNSGGGEKSNGYMTYMTPQSTCVRVI